MFLQLSGSRLWPSQRARHGCSESRVQHPATAAAYCALSRAAGGAKHSHIAFSKHITSRRTIETVSKLDHRLL